MPALARLVAGASGVVHAGAIGDVASRNPFEESTSVGDPPDSFVQQLKYLWHTVVAHGIDAIAVRG